MKKKTLIITSVLAVGLIGFAGYKASALYVAASDEKEKTVRMVEETAVSLAEKESDDDKNEKQSIVNLNAERSDRDDDNDDADKKQVNTQEKSSVKVDRDDDDDDDDKDDNKANANHKNKKQNIITAEKAISITQKKYPGQLKEIELDNDDGKQVYEIEIQTKRGEVELEIDAKTGKILDVDFDD